MKRRKIVTGKKTIACWMAAALSIAVLSGCGGSQANKAGDEPKAKTQQESSEASEAAEKMTSEAGKTADQAAADEVAKMIDAIYVQEWTEQTEAQCKEAKEAWDALTPEQKELVEGHFADPDYFGRDTGDAAADNPLNQDNIGENEILVVSFGTSFNDSRAEDIGGIERAIQNAYPDWSVRRAFTAQIIINHILARDGIAIDNMEQAMERAVKNGVKHLVIQPTHLMHGAEYDELSKTAERYRPQFESMKIAEPLLGEVGADANEINEDKEAVVCFIYMEHGAVRLKACLIDSVIRRYEPHGMLSARRRCGSRVRPAGRLFAPAAACGQKEGKKEHRQNPVYGLLHPSIPTHYCTTAPT